MAPGIGVILQVNRTWNLCNALGVGRSIALWDAVDVVLFCGALRPL